MAGVDFTRFERWFGGGRDGVAAAAADSIAASAGRIQRLRPFPVVAQRLVSLARDPLTSVDDLASVIRQDPGLAIRVLASINSSARGLRTPCNDLSHAIVLLGFSQIQELAVSMIMLGSFSVDSVPGLAVRAHSIATAGVAHQLCQLRPELCDLPGFTCGLLHDLGKLMLLQVGEDGYEELLESCVDAPESACLREGELLGYDHATLAAVLLEEWAIPIPLTLAVGWHHRPERAHRLGGLVGKLVDLVRLADRLVHQHLSSADHHSGEIDRLMAHASVDRLGFERSDIEGLVASLEVIITDSYAVLS